MATIRSEKKDTRIDALFDFENGFRKMTDYEICRFVNRATVTTDRDYIDRLQKSFLIVS